MNQLRNTALFFLVCIFYAYSSFAYDDTTAYSNLLIKIRSQSLEKQLLAVEDYLAKNPNSLYKKELESNLLTLKNLFPKEELTEEKSQKSKDTELFFKAQGLAKTLRLSDKIQLWEQFLNENPHSIYYKDAQYNLNKLKERQRASQPRTAINANVAQNQETVAGKKLPYKDRKRAMTLATTAGLVVPGMGHWYTEDYVPAGIMTGLRVIGVGLFAKGFYDNSRSTQVTGFLIGLFSYVADVADAPFSVERYNEKVDQRFKNQANSFSAISLNHPKHSFMLSFKF